MKKRVYIGKKNLDKAYTIIILITLFFFTTALLGAVVGNFVDTHFGTRPFGTLVTLIGFYVSSWIIFKVYYTFTKSKLKVTKDVSNREPTTIN